MGWPTKKLSDVLDIQNGYAFDSKQFSSEEGMPLIRIRDISNGLKTVTNYAGKYKSIYVVRKGDFLIGMDGEFRCYEWKGEDALLNQRVCRLQNFSDELSAKFLSYGINKYLQDIEDVTGFTTVKHISASQIKNIEFPIPPIPEQQRIVAILDQAFADIERARANAEKNLKNARELFDSYLNQVFSQRGEGWVEKSLREVCDFLNGFAFKSSDALDESNVQLIRMGNLYKNVLNLDRKPSFYPSGFADEYKKYLLTEGDLIISLTGTTGKRDYGFTVEVPACDRQLLLNQRIAKIKEVDANQIQKRFLLRILKSPFFLDELYASANGTRQANLSTSALKDIAISFPSIERQIELIAVFESIDLQCHDLEVTYKTKLKSLDELKKSLLQKAFSGELTKTEGMVA
jgi:type I restriction enzyme S subunit